MAGDTGLPRLSAPPTSHLAPPTSHLATAQELKAPEPLGTVIHAPPPHPSSRYKRRLWRSSERPRRSRFLLPSRGTYAPRCCSPSPDAPPIVSSYTRLQVRRARGACGGFKRSRGFCGMRCVCLCFARHGRRLSAVRSHPSQLLGRPPLPLPNVRCGVHDASETPAPLSGFWHSGAEAWGPRFVRPRCSVNHAQPR